MWGPNPIKCEAAARELSSALGLPVSAARDAETAVRGAEIVATCTTSELPVLDASWVTPGALVISVGSFEPHRREVGRDLIERAAHVVVDDIVTACEHAGPIIDALRCGALGQNDLISLSDCMSNARPLPRNSHDVVYYNSTGLGIQDAAAAWAIIQRARVT